MTATLAFGPYSIDPANATLTRGGHRLELAPKAFDLLALLAGRPGQLVTKDEIFDTVWGRRFVSESAVKSVVSCVAASSTPSVATATTSPAPTASSTG